MFISSPVFNHEGTIPDKYTCKGENISPALEWGDIPEAAKSLALIFHDPDAPGDKGFTHWILWNIPASIKGLEENVERTKGLPAGTKQGITGYRKHGYGGPCPPKGVHRYYFYLYALDTTLELPESTTKEKLQIAMEGHVIDSARWMGKFSKSG